MIPAVRYGPVSRAKKVGIGSAARSGFSSTTSWHGAARTTTGSSGPAIALTMKGCSAGKETSRPAAMRSREQSRLPTTRMLLPAALAATKRGVLFDVGHGGGSFDFTVAEAAMQQGAGPDTISSDIHVFSGNSPGMPYLTWVMSKFMALGFTLEQVVQMATAAPARAINRMPMLGSLQVGAPGDATLVEVAQGPVEFVDTRNNKRSGKAHIKPVQAVLAGVPFGRPYLAPFSVR